MKARGVEDTGKKKEIQADKVTWIRKNTLLGEGRSSDCILKFRVKLRERHRRKDYGGKGKRS